MAHTKAAQPPPEAHADARIRVWGLKVRGLGSGMTIPFDGGHTRTGGGPE